MSTQSPINFNMLTQMSPLCSKLCRLTDKRWNFIHCFKVTHISVRKKGGRYETDKKFKEKGEEYTNKYIFHL
jgi:hypothetical protein